MATTTDNTPAEKNQRHRRTKLEVAKAKEEKAKKLLAEARAAIAAAEHQKDKAARKKRLFPAAGNMLRLIDEMKLPDGITDNDLFLALRRLMAALRRRDGETFEAYSARVSPHIGAIFGGDARTPADNAAIRILTGHSRAAETVDALRSQRGV